MMTDDDCPDIDLLGRYQLQMYFFQYALDEKVLEVWTGKKSVVEIFASPEFEGLECFREACPPHNLLVMVDRAKSKMETNSVAVGTEDTNIPSSNAMDPFELVESTSCTEEIRCLDPLPLPNGDAGKDTIEAQLNNSGSTEQSIEISGFNAIPKVQKRINSTTSDASGSCMNSTKEHSSTAATEGILTVEASREQVSSTVKEEIPVNSSSSESNASKDSEQQITQSEQDPSLKLLQQAGIFPREMLQAVPEMSEENLSQPTCGSVNPSSSFESTPTCFRVSQVDASLGQQPAQAETINGGSVAVAASPDSQSIEIDLKMARSVLEGLEFPDINGDVINHLTFIRKQVLEYHERHAIIPRLENILACLREKISSQWIDYVLYYIPDVSVMPVDGQVFVVWKGK
ncbi:hypothetical protein TELCIR_11094 [Teladorsagia circumcincta]|uniref:Uncharacterized protein n=1 Tax=Teladorsagia circumcincta TaxID=45464 RepID=A0A2G9UAB0_TELCI|nr:hypothetical protein TELCIR_11094 [Teladorsagia circumcincta]